MIRAIAAIDDKRGLARGGAIPWSIPADSRYFRDQTEHGIVLMGHDTYKEFAEPLPNRRNLVASRSLTGIRQGFELVNDVAAFLENVDEDVWIIGGAGLYTATLGFCTELYLTHVHGDFDCDRFFPDYIDTFMIRHQSLTEHDGDYRYEFMIFDALKNR